MFRDKFQYISILLWILGVKSTLIWIFSRRNVNNPRIIQTAIIDSNKFYVRAKTSDLSIIYEIFSKNIYDNDFDLKKGDTVLDVGGHIGIFAIKASREVGDSGSIYTFEPVPTNFALLKKNLELNRLENTKAFNVAVSDKNNENVTFHINDFNTGMGSINFEDGSSKSIVVQTITLDDFVKEHSINLINFMKIDVEGHEVSVLQGAKHCLAICQKIVLESHQKRGGPLIQILSQFYNITVFEQECKS